MTATLGKKHWFLFVALGVVSIVLGAIAWVDAISVTLASTIVLGALLIAAGVAQVIHAFAVKDWGGFLFSILGGALYVVGGGLLIEEPVAGSVVITIFVAVSLVISGVTRAVIAARHRELSGWWVVLLGGLFSFVVGVTLYATLPWSGLWLIGTIIAAELIFVGVGWIQFGLALRRGAIATLGTGF